MANTNDTDAEKDGDAEEVADEGEHEVVKDDAEDAGKKSDEGEKGKEGEKKPEETPEAKRARLKRQLARLDKDHPEEKKETATKKSDIDYGQKAYLMAAGLKDAEEQALALKAAKDTGKSLDEVLSNKYFQAELKDIRDAKAAEEATPSGKRSGLGARDTVEYWIGKGSMPEDKPENRELRQKIVNAKMKAQSSGSPFSQRTIVGNA